MANNYVYIKKKKIIFLICNNDENILLLEEFSMIKSFHDIAEMYTILSKSQEWAM